MIINKIQGQSLKVIGFFLKEQAFNHGQLDVVFSQVTLNNRLKIITYDNKEKPFNYTKNIVYKDVIGSISRELLF
jgi:ATP-dependent DNA helicase PIF1